MGNSCAQSDATQVEEKGQVSLRSKSEPGGGNCSALLRVRMAGTVKTWIKENLKMGSSISVASSDVKQYWVWERSGNDEPLWRLRLNETENLYVTYDDDGKITMQPAGPRSVFLVAGTSNGNFVFFVPVTRKFISEVDGKLALTEANTQPTEWALTAKKEDDQMDVTSVEDNFVITEKFSTKKWVCDQTIPGSSVLVDSSYADQHQAQWFGKFIVSDEAWHFQPRVNTDLFVTCDVSSSTITLETANNENEKQRLVKTDESESIVTMQDVDKQQYFCSQAMGQTALLEMTADAKLSTPWEFLFYALIINGTPVPPDPSCEGQQKPLENTPDVQVTLSQEAQVPTADDKCTASETSTSVEVIMWRTQDGSKEQWINADLQSGSRISVAVSSEDNVWIWERNFTPNGLFWRIRSDANQNLYLTYDDSDNLTMQPDGPTSKSYFEVLISIHDKFVIRFPENQKYVTVSGGKLVLSEDWEEWCVSLQTFEHGKAKPIFNIRSGQDMWVRSNEYILVCQADVHDVLTQWHREKVSREKQDSFWMIQPKDQVNLNVAHNAEKSNPPKVFLQSVESAETSIGDMKLKKNGVIKLKISDMDEENFFLSLPIRRKSMVSLTTDSTIATEWEFKHYAWKINGRLFPPNPKCGEHSTKE